MTTSDVYGAIAADLIGRIEAGIANPKGWEKPWVSTFMGQYNAETGNTYLGFNQLALSMTAMAKNYDVPVWATYKQWERMGNPVQAGFHGTKCVKWVEPGRSKEPARTKRLTRSKETRNTEEANQTTSNSMRPVVFTLFNAAQVKGYTYEPASPRPEHERRREAEHLIRAMKADGLKMTEQNVDAAYYVQAEDTVVTPPINAFHSADGYYATKFHEIAHSTSHKRRLHRELTGRFGSKEYAAEELIAELGSAFLCAETGIADSRAPHHANYLAGWLRLLKDDPKAFSTAASKAQKAAHYVLGLTRQLDRPSTEHTALDVGL